MKQIKFINDGHKTTMNIKTFWNELSKNELLLLAKSTVYSWPFAKAAVLLFSMFNGLKLIRFSRVSLKSDIAYTFKHNKQRFNVSPLDMRAIVNQLKWPFHIVENDETNIQQFMIKPLLTKNLLPKLRVGPRTFYGPSDALLNITYNEFVYAETNFIRFVQSGDNKYLYQLLAVLYRPRISLFSLAIKHLSHAYEGDIRTRFNPVYIDKRANKISKIQLHKAYAVLWFYQGCRVLLHKKFPSLFNTDGDNDNYKIDAFESFMNLSNAATDGDPSKLKNIKTQLLWEVLKKLDVDVYSANQQKKRLKSQNK